MKHFTYWKEIQIEPWMKFMIVPRNTLDETDAFFDKIVSVIKNSDCSWVMTDETEVDRSKQ